MDQRPSIKLKTPDVFLHIPTTLSTDEGSPTTVVFFITGNPGLIGYYHEFLDLLCHQSPPPWSQLRSEDEGSSDSATSSSSSTTHTSTPERSVVVAGFSLGGFELEDPTPPTSTQIPDLSAGIDSESKDTQRALAEYFVRPPGIPRKEVYGLRDQIELCYARLCKLVEVVESNFRTGVGINVVLMGHSVGAYIALEMVRMHHRYCQQHHQQGTMTSRQATFDITASVLLTPTIRNIAHSRSGRVATPLLTYLPLLPSVAQVASTSLAGLLPRSRLRGLVGWVTGMKDVEGGALDATAEFLGRAGCVRQALHLARDEMKEIGVDEWGGEVWGVIEEREQQGDLEGRWRAPKLWFWFARQDHWVADVTREEIVTVIRERYREEEKRAGQNEERSWRPEVLVDEDQGLNHAWCIEQSTMVAKQVGIWLEESLSLSN